LHFFALLVRNPRDNAVLGLVNKVGYISVADGWFLPVFFGEFRLIISGKAGKKRRAGKIYFPFPEHFFQLILEIAEADPVMDAGD
jgi:hypothetical protein